MATQVNPVPMQIVGGTPSPVDPILIQLLGFNPWTSDIDAGGFGLLNCSSLQFAPSGSISGIVEMNMVGGTTYTDDHIASISGVSDFWLTPDANFGIHNGEPPGVGADINLVSDNGNVVVTGTEIDLVSSGLISITGQVNIDGLISSISGSALSLMDDATFGIHNMEPPGVGSDINFISDNGGVVISPKLLVGATVDDGTSAPIQSGGDISASTSYWCSVRQGGSGFYVLDADGVTTHEIVGGIVMN